MNSEDGIVIRTKGIYQCSSRKDKASIIPDYYLFNLCLCIKFPERDYVWLKSKV